MKSRFHLVLMVSLAAMFLVGCSVRTVPLEKEQIIYEDGYYHEYDSLPPSFLYDTWQLSQYYQDYGYASEFGYLSPHRMNIDPNPHDSYRADEKPVQRAPVQRSIQGTSANRRVREHQNHSASQRLVSRSRHARSSRVAADSKADRNRFREQLRQRHRQRRTNAVEG